MKLDLNVKKNQSNILTGKNQFLVSDLKRLINKIDDNAKVEFGVIEDNNVIFQEENIIFRISERDREQEINDEYVFEILTMLNQ